MTRKFLIWLSNRFEGAEQSYPQTSYILAKLPFFLQPVYQWLCGRLVNHEMSETEWGYSGGGFAERNCRWCDKKFLVAKESITEEFPDSAHMIEDFDAEHAQH